MNTLSKAIKLALYGSSIGFISSAYAETVTHLNTIEVSAETQNSSSEETGRYTQKKAKGSNGMALSAKDTPQSVTAVTHQQMRDQNLNTIAKALETTHGVSVSLMDRGRYSFSARGFGIDKIKVDGMDLKVNNQWTTGENTGNSVLYDRVEVVRGATGLTTGAGDPSASVNLVRKRANSTSRYTILEAGIGRYADFNTMIDHSQALNNSGSVRGRFIAEHKNGNTFIKNEKERYTTLYGNIEADLTDTTKLGLGVSYQKEKRDAALWGGLPAFYSDGGETNWSRSKNASPEWAYWDNESVNYFADITQKLGEKWELALKGNYRVGKHNSELFYFSGSSLNRQDGLGWSPWPGKFKNDNTQSNVQLDLTGSFSAWGLEHDAAIGIQYNRVHRNSYAADNSTFDGAFDFNHWNGVYARPKWGSMSEKYYQNLKEFGAYASTRLRLTDRLSMLLGSRISSYRTEGTFYGSTQNFHANDVWTPYAGLTFDINPQNTVYVSYTDIFKPQSQVDINNKLLSPVTGETYEAGWKGNYFNDNLHTQISVFETRQDNLAQSSGINPNTLLAYYTASKGAKVRGFEVEASGNVTEKLKLSAGYTQWKGDDASGKPINTTQPRKQFKFFATYDMNRLVQGLTVGAGVNWQSRIYTKHATYGEYGQKSYALVNLMARYQFNDNFSAQLNIDNLFDKKYRNALSFSQYSYGEPFYTRLNLRYEF